MASLAMHPLRTRQAIREIAMPVCSDDPDECDCGRPKDAFAECCDHCGFLDGVSLHPAARSGGCRAAVVAELRLMERMTLHEIAAAVWGVSSPNSRRMAMRVLAELIAARRVTKELVEDNHDMRNVFGRYDGRGSHWHQVYALCAKRGAS